MDLLYCKTWVGETAAPRKREEMIASENLQERPSRACGRRVINQSIAGHSPIREITFGAEREWRAESRASCSSVIGTFGLCAGSLCSSRSSPQLAILPRSRFLSAASRSPSTLAKPGSDPRCRAEKAFQQRGDVEIGVKLGKMNSKAGGADLDLFKLRGLRAFQPLGVSGREADAQFRAEIDHDTSAFAVIPRGDGSRDSTLQVLAAHRCYFVSIRRCHESSPIPCKGL